MVKLLNSVLSYFLIPIYSAILLFVLFYHLPVKLPGYTVDLVFLKAFLKALAFFSLPLLLFLIKPLHLTLDTLIEKIKSAEQYTCTMGIFLVCVIVAGGMDIEINGFKWLDPLTYSDISGPGRLVRHISMLCWILIPFAVLFIRQTLLKYSLISYALIFPILIIDRNRFFLSIYSLFFCYLIQTRGFSALQKKRLIHLSIFCILACLLIFGLIGQMKSRAADLLVLNSGNILLKSHYPLSSAYYFLPGFLQQIVIYITAPFLNLVTIIDKQFINPEFLLSQFSPFSRDLYPVSPEAPILIKRFNVGTEFYPFLLYGGLPLAVLAMTMVYTAFTTVYCLFRKYSNIFTFLIFLKLSYNVILMGFGPQIFMLYNLGFVVLMLGLWAVSVLWLKIRSKLFIYIANIKPIMQ